jgi:hypothetical protein
LSIDNLKETKPMAAYFVDQVAAIATHLDDNGFLRVKGRIARIGVQKYIKGSKVVRVLRDTTEVVKSAKDFSHTPITLDHPVERVISTETSHLIKGYSGNIAYTNGWLEGDIIITHQDAIDAAATTHNQLSAGYYADIIEESGIWVDSLGVMGSVGAAYDYDCVQKEIKSNHIALVAKARAGDQAKLQLDSEDAFISDVDNYNNKQLVFFDKMDKPDKQDNMAIDAKQLAKVVKASVSDAIASEKEQEEKQAEAQRTQTKIADLEGRLAALQVENDSLKAEVNSLKTNNQPTMDAAQIAAEVEARLNLWEQTKSVIGDVDYTLDTTGIKKAYLVKKAPAFAKDIDAKAVAFIDGMFEVLVASPNTQTQEQIIDSQSAKTETETKLTVADAFNQRFARGTK